MNSAQEVQTRYWSQATEFPHENQYHAVKYFSPRWRKTQVTLFSSCVNSDKIRTKEPPLKEHLNTKLIPPTITTNGVEEPKNNSKDGAMILEQPRETSPVIDDVFLAPPSPERRASEPSNQDGGSSFFGRRKQKLNRSLSASVVKGKRPAHEHKKLTKSKSTGTGCRGEGNGSMPPSLNFSPEFVHKTSLKTSLHDWLGSHKVHTKNARKPKRHNSDQENEKQLEKSGVLSQGTWQPDSKNDPSSSRHVYRRYSAEQVNCKPPEKQCCSRRPSAPPCLNDPEAHDLTCSRRKSVKVRTMTVPANIQHAALVSCCNTDTKYANLLDFHLHCVMKEELRSRLGGLCFRPESCRDWCEEISENIKTRVQLLNSTPCKVICTVYIGALRDFGLHSATQALLDYKLDHHASACYQNKSLFAVASVFAIKYRSK